MVSLSASGTTLVIGHSATNSVQVYIPWTQPISEIISITPSSGPVGTLVKVTGTDLNLLTASTIGGQPAIPVSNNGTFVSISADRNRAIIGEPRYNG